MIKILALVILLSGGCKKDEPNILTVNPTSIEIPKEGGSANLTLTNDANSWQIKNPASGWLTLSKSSGVEQKITIVLTVNTSTNISRADTLTITAGTALPVKVVVSQAASEMLYTLTASVTNLSLQQAGGSSTPITITTTAPQWNISSSADWIQFSQVTGNSGSSTIDISAKDNPTTEERNATIILTAENSPSVQIIATQAGGLYPSYNISPIAPDSTGMSSKATEIASKIKLGWNIGNTLEAIGGETAWGNPKISKAYIDFVKQTGFNAIRLPCSWDKYADANAQIQADWLERVHEVIQYCIDDDLYVILNIHWDGGWLEENCTKAKQVENNAKQKAFWEQIATKLRDFDEHLLFASANEPNVDDATKMEVLLSYHQTFINAVRSTGGKNRYRVLVVQGPSTDIEKTNQLMKSLPVDKIANRMMVEIHYYTPWNFTGMTKDESWGKMFYYWGKGYHSTTDPDHNPTWGEESDVDKYFKMMKTQFVDKGIPVVMGEYGCGVRTNLTGEALTLHKASRAYYFKYLTKQAKANGMLPFFWDTGGMLDRRNNTVIDQQGLDGIIQGGTE